MRTSVWVALLTLVITAQAQALTNRVFVSPSGMDVGTCTITSPCRSFNYAISQVAPGGEVIALDTAGYGTFTISQTVTVFAAPGATAFIAVNGGTGITVIAGAADVIVLRGLALSANGGARGVDFQSGLSLSLENCIVNGFTNAGVQMVRVGDMTNPRLRIEGSTIRNNNNGIYITNSSPPAVTVGLTVANSSVSENSFGLLATDNTRGQMTDTVFFGNGTAVTAYSAVDNSAPDLSLERCTISGNGTGISSGFSTMVGGQNRGIVRIAHNQITANELGVYEFGDGKILTMTSGGFLTNTIEGNVTDGTFTGSYSAR